MHLENAASQEIKHKAAMSNAGEAAVGIPMSTKPLLQFVNKILSSTNNKAPRPAKECIIWWYI